MADEGVAEHYQVLEELGREFKRLEILLGRLINFRFLGGSFGIVYKGIEKTTGETVAIKHVSPKLLRLPGPPAHNQQIDLESNDDDIQDIQAEIAVLSTCASSYVTQYKGSFLRGHKLWIVMEFLGGGSCLDLVSLISSNETL